MQLRNHQPLIIDTREPEEYEISHVNGALNVPSTEFENLPPFFTDVDRSTSIVLYCRTGRRASRCQEVLEENGFSNVINGINEQNVDEYLEGKHATSI